jgi:stress response protein YsnF
VESNLEPTELILPVHSESLVVNKHSVVTAKVTVQTKTVSREETVRDTLSKKTIEITREKVNQLSSECPESFEEGDTLVIPVVEEVYVKQYLTTEIVKVRTVKTSEAFEKTVTLRSQDVEVQRTEMLNHDQSKEI